MIAHRIPALCVLAVTSFATASSRGQELRLPVRRNDPWSLMGEGRYLAGLKAAEDSSDPMAQHNLGVLRAAVGDYAGAKEAMGESTTPVRDTALRENSALAAAERLDAVAAIVAEAKNRQVVILNEAHHVPETRTLTLAVARALRKQGFSYLACEAFSPKILDYARVGYPSTGNCSGYLLEPVFADLVRQSARLGYTLVHYETESPGTGGDRNDSINARETDQCRHLIERIFSKDPEAKVLIHCGYSHATEDWRKVSGDRELAWMAARLARELGIDPLTVDQTYQRQASVPGAGPLSWRYAVKQDWLPRPSVFRNPDGTYYVEGSSWKDRVDIQVFHPATEDEDGRPSWLAMDGYRKPVEIPVELEPESERVLIQAFVAEEGEDAVPMDQVIWYADDLSPVLMLPMGNYRVVAQGEDGKEIGRAKCVSE